MALVKGLIVQVLEYIGSKHSVQLPVTIVPGLGRHLFLRGPAVTRGVNMIIATNSYLNMGSFIVPLRKDSHWSSLHHLDLTTGATSRPRFRLFPAATLNRKPPSLFTLQLLLKLLPSLHPFQLTSGIGGWVIPMVR